MYRLLASIDKKEDHIFSPDTEFLVNECGHYRIIKLPDYYLARPHGRPDYQLLYVAEGCAWFMVDGVDTPANAGDFIIYSPRYPQYYHYHLADKTDLYWLHFYGTETEDFLKSIGLTTNQVLSSQFDSQISKEWTVMIRELAIRQRNFETLVPLYAKKIMALLSRMMKPQNAVQSRSQAIIIDAIEYFSNKFDGSINIRHLARDLGVSVCWLNLNFKNYTGVSPMQYVINLRLSHAKDQLRSTDYTIAEIAQLAGYDDPLYFSRLFKKHVGCSPREYRKKHKVV